MPEPILEVRKLNKSFGPVHVLHDVDLAVYPGEVTALVGDNGAGKSTLVKCIAGINTIDNGEVLFEGFGYASLWYGGTVEESEAGTLTILKSDQISTAQSIAKGIRTLPIVLTLLVLILYGFAIWLAGPRRREALHLHTEGRDAREIAAELGIPLSTLYLWIRREARRQYSGAVDAGGSVAAPDSRL